MKSLRLLAVVVAAMLLMAAPALAQDRPGDHSVSLTASPKVAAAFGAALTIIGAGYGFAKIGGTALESIARQPEAANNIRGTMIVAAALLEGATFFALVVCLLAALLT